MNTKTERKLMNFITLFYLLQGIHVYRKAQKKCGYVERIQKKRLQKFLRYVYSFSFYKERFDKAGIKPEQIKTASDLLAIPPVTKQEYRDWINKELKEHPEKYRYHLQNATSGSTGLPLVLMETPAGAASDIANLYRALYIQNKGFSVFRDSILHICVHSTGNRQSIVQKLGFFRYFKTEIGIGYDNCIKQILCKKPDCIMANKTILLSLVDYAKKQSALLPCPKLILSTGEKLDETSRLRINNFFGKEIVFDVYGSTETGNFAIGKTANDRLHTVWHDTHIVNLLNPQENKDGTRTGEILITPLRHTGFPLINYRIEDSIVYDTIHKNGMGGVFLKYLAA